jgi:propane monooxygenase small subunit
VDQEWERTHYQRQSTIIGMINNVVANGRRARAPSRFDKAWVKVLQDHVGAFKHAEFGLGKALMFAQRYGYTQMINNAILTNSSYKLRFAQDLALYLGELALDIEGLDLAAGKKHWVEDPIWQGTRRAVEDICGCSDPLEIYFAINFAFEPLVAELFRSGFVMQDAAAQNDFMTPAVVSAAESDYEQNLANAVELFSILGSDPEFGPHNRGLFETWMTRHGTLAYTAAQLLQPIWSQPRVKIATFTEALDSAVNRVRAIGSEVGFDAVAALPL